MLTGLDPRRLLAHCVRCGLFGTVLCPACADLPLLRACTPGGLPVFGVGRYTGHLASCVRRLKYRDETHLAFPLGTALWELGRSAGLPFAGASVLPIPLHPLRLAERGFNQSALIAAHLSGRGGTRLVTACLHRADHRRAQARLSAAERRANLEGAFVARPHGQLAACRAVFLLDDVVTTGSTVDSCARALTEIGVNVRGVLACALTELPSTSAGQSA